MTRPLGDLETAIAFVAKRSGKPSMPAAEWAHHLAFGLGWMAPGQARAFVERAQAAGVLVVEGEALRIAPSAAEVQAPLGFRPKVDAEATPRAAAPGPDDPFAQWLDRVAVHQKVTRPQVLQQVSERQQRMSGLLTAWAALLWIAADAGLDVREAARLKV